jgi:hypothetical protein
LERFGLLEFLASQLKAFDSLMKRPSNGVFHSDSKANMTAQHGAMLAPFALSRQEQISGASETV